MNAKGILNLITKLERKNKVYEHEELNNEELAKELADSLGNIEMEEEIKNSLTWDKGRYQDWGDAGSFEADGKEYNIIEGEDEAERIAIALVKQDLEDEPEIFNKDFLERFIYISDTDRRLISVEDADSIAGDLYYDLNKENYGEVFDRLDISDEWDEWEEKLSKAEELDSEKEDSKEYEKVKEELEKYLKEEIEEWKDNYAEELEGRLEDPIQYFVKDEGMYSMEDLMKQSFIQINTDEAAEAAVDEDGWAHFLSLYDGNYETTKSGYVYFRE